MMNVNSSYKNLAPKASEEGGRDTDRPCNGYDSNGDDDDDASSLLSGGADASDLAGSIDGLDGNMDGGDHSDEDEIPLASRETQAVNAGKVLVFLVLIIATGVMAYLTFWFTSEDEEDAFEISFKSFAQEILSVADSNARQTISIIKSVSTATTSYAFRAGDLKWPFVTIPDFELRAQEALELSGAELIMFTPIVSRLGGDAWGIYAIQNQDWIRQGLDFQGKTYVDPGNVLPVIHTGSKDKSATAATASGSTRESFAPLWQYAPAPTSAALVNLDLFQAFPWYERLAKGVKVVRHALLSEQVNVSYILPEENVDKMRSVTVHPVFESFDHNASIKGLLSAVLPWDGYFSNVLPPGTKRLDIEVRDSCGSAFTYAVEGPHVQFLGKGLLHDPKYTEFGESDAFASFARIDGQDVNATAASEFDKKNDVLQSCNYTMTVYPTDEFYGVHSTNKPIMYTSVVVLVFLFTAMVFVLYDWLVGRRQAKVLSAAARTTAIIASLFPKQVQRRILQEAEEKAKLGDHDGGDSKGAGGTGGGGRKRRKFRAAKSDLKDFLGEHPDGKGNKSSNNSTDGHTTQGGSSTTSLINNRTRRGKAIADLFPSTTIMFADIVGFTAWSSAREPAQVFELLETVYGHFDAMAAQRRVFKVETVGDCYVAVVGLPDPRKDHAVVMSRFARDCITAFGKVVKELERELGPDTGDLMLRAGLHSGPVTAGVLRGERARFQLFGDTVNTTARMESNSKPNKVQLSQETADLLIEAGKGHWIKPREETVQAKGKGSLNTFWLIYKEGAEKSATTAANDSTTTMENYHGATGVKEDKSGQKLPMNVPALPDKHYRLVVWNRDLLTGKLNDIVARREAHNVIPASPHVMRELELAQLKKPGMVLDEVAEIIELPKFEASKKHIDSNDIQLEDRVLMQLENYIKTLSVMYRNNPFHNFEHASHVTLSVSKLFSRIVAPDIEYKSDGEVALHDLHDHTYGITSDPLTQFAVLLSALIHDVDHVGVPNTQLIKEHTSLAEAYNNKSIAEQNSVDIAWRTLMDDRYQDLRRTIYCTESEFHRFRQLVVNTVLATDIMDKDLKNLRNGRWERAFSETPVNEDVDTAVNRKATIVIEHLIQASDIAHTMQHWHVYRKWNERLFREMTKAYKEGRADKDPADFWYKGEIGFFDFYIIPLAKKLADCGVFGVSSDEYLNYAIQNRREWEQRGRDVVATFRESLAKEEAKNNSNDNNNNDNDNGLGKLPSPMQLGAPSMVTKEVPSSASKQATATVKTTPYKQATPTAAMKTTPSTRKESLTEKSMSSDGEDNNKTTSTTSPEEQVVGMTQVTI